MDKFQIEVLVKNLTAYFDNDNISIILTEEEENKYTIMVKVLLEDVNVDISVKFKINCNERYTLEDDNNNPVSFGMIWKYLFEESIVKYNMAVKRILKLSENA